MTHIQRLLAAILLACGLAAFAPVMPAPIQNTIIASAKAGTYEDDVFPRGYPRWGTSIRTHEDRNIRYGRAHRGGHVHHSGHAQGSRLVAIGTYRHVYRSAAFAGERSAVRGRATCGTPRCYSRPSRPVMKSACRTGCNPKPACSTCKAGAKQTINERNNANVKVIGSPGANVVVIQGGPKTQVISGGPAAGSASAGGKLIAGYAPKTLTTFSCEGKPRGVPIACGAASPNGLCFCKEK